MHRKSLKDPLYTLNVLREDTFPFNRIKPQNLLGKYIFKVSYTRYIPGYLRLVYQSWNYIPGIYLVYTMSKLFRVSRCIMMYLAGSYCISWLGFPQCTWSMLVTTGIMMYIQPDSHGGCRSYNTGIACTVYVLWVCMSKYMPVHHDPGCQAEARDSDSRCYGDSNSGEIWNPIHLDRIRQNRTYWYVLVRTSTYRYRPVQE